MPLIHWNDSMKLGVPEVDFEHEELVGLINALGDSLQNSHNINGVLGLLGEIHAQIESHFALEEKIMRETKYAGYMAHKEDHDRLLDQIRDIMVEVTSMEEATLFNQLGERLDAWFSNHFRTLDQSFHNFIDH